MTVRFGTLRADLTTPIGTYPAGTRIVLVPERAQGGRGIVICLDWQHLTGVCHKVAVPASSVDAPRQQVTTRSRGVVRAA